MDVLTTAVTSGFTFLTQGVTFITGNAILLAILGIGIAGGIVGRVKSLL